MAVDGQSAGGRWGNLRNAIAPYRDWASIAGILLSSLSFGSVARSLFTLNLPVFQTIIDAYVTIIREPFGKLMSWVGINPTELQADIIILYIIFGTTTIGALFRIYNPKYTRVSKGFWGTISKGININAKGVRRYVAKSIYVALAVLLWPLIFFEYSLRYRNIWIRYMDVSHNPDFDAVIGTFTSNAKTTSEFWPGKKFTGYNPRIDYDTESDTWYALRGSFPAIFFTGLFFILLAFFLSIMFAYLAGL